MIRLIVGMTAALALLAPRVAHADFRVVSPYEIDFGELELEHNGSAVFDRRADQRGANSYTTEIGTGLTPWWHTELEVAFDRAAGVDQPTLVTALVWENMIQLTEPGEHFFDTGFYFEYGQSLTRGAASASNQMTFGPVIAKETGSFLHTLNLFFTIRRNFTFAGTSMRSGTNRCWRNSSCNVSSARADPLAASTPVNSVAAPVMSARPCLPLLGRLTM